MSDYEELLKQGYTEEEIKVILDGISKVELTDAPIGKSSAEKPRYDKSVTVTDSEGRSKKTSSILMGYNKNGIRLADGEYLSWKEVEQLIRIALSDKGENVTFISKKSGEAVELADIIEDVFKEATTKSAYLTYEQTDRITNQTAAKVTVHDQGEDYNKGLAMLGNVGIKLPTGEFLSKEQIELALREYFQLIAPEKKPLVPPIPPTPTPSEVQPAPTPIPPEPTMVPEETYVLINDMRRRLSAIPLLAGAVIEALAGFGYEPVYTQTEVPGISSVLPYTVAQVQDLVDVYETEDNVLERMYDEIDIGKRVSVGEGTKFYSNSDAAAGNTVAHRQGTFGEGLRESGEYTIDSFSIFLNGENVSVTWDNGEDLYSKLESIAKENNVEISELLPTVHLGGPVSGWVNVSDLFDDASKEPQIKAQDVVLDEENVYSDTIYDFEGDTITINTGEEEVVIQIKDEDGNLLESGQVVTGSNGEQYQIVDLSLQETEVIDYDYVETGQKLNWSFKNITLEEHLAAAAVAIVGTLISARKKKDMVEMTGSQIDALIDKERREFEEAKGQYGGSSAFEQATETLTGKQVQPTSNAHELLREELIGQEITVRQVREMDQEVGGAVKK